MTIDDLKIEIQFKFCLLDLFMFVGRLNRKYRQRTHINFKRLWQKEWRMNERQSTINILIHTRWSHIKPHFEAAWIALHCFQFLRTGCVLILSTNVGLTSSRVRVVFSYSIKNRDLLTYIRWRIVIFIAANV